MDAARRSSVPVPDQAEQLERLKSSLASRYRIERELGHGGMAMRDSLPQCP
jgi:hypothetical protein